MFLSTVVRITVQFHYLQHILIMRNHHSCLESSFLLRTVLTMIQWFCPLSLWRAYLSVFFLFSRIPLVGISLTFGNKCGAHSGAQFKHSFLHYYLLHAACDFCLKVFATFIHSCYDTEVLETRPVEGRWRILACMLRNYVNYSYSIDRVLHSFLFFSSFFKSVTISS